MAALDQNGERYSRGLRALLNWNVFIASFFLAAVPALAHHSDAGRYDETIIVLSGTVVSVQLVNPHSMIVMDVEENGKTVRWQCELGTPRQLVQNYGWTRETLKPGDRITMTGRRIKTGAPYFNLTERAQIRRTETGEELYRTDNYEAPADAAAAPEAAD